MTLLRSLAAGVGLAALATSALAQSAPSAEEIAILRAQVQALSARLEQLEAQSQTAAQAAPLAAGSPAAVTATAPRPVQTAATTPAPAAPSVDWSTGIPELRSPDGAFTFKPRIRIMVDATATNGSDFGARNIAGTELRAVRLGGQGKLGGGLSYWAEGDLADNTISLNNVFVAYTRKFAGNDLEVSFGQRLNDRGLEGGTSEDQVPFLERSLMISTLSAQRGAFGVGVSSKLTGANWHASLSVTGDAVGDGVTNDTTTVMGRVHWSPMKTEKGFLHLGAFGFIEDLTPFATLPSRGITIDSHFNDNLRLSTGAYANPKGAKTLGLELGGVRRSGWLLAEGGRRVVETASRDFDQNGYAISAGWFLTGETPPLSTRTGTWQRPKVLKPFGTEGYGAVEVVGRYDFADLSDNPTGGEGDAWVLGLNWYPTNNTRVSAHWSAWSVENRTGAFLGEDSGNTALLRVQTGF
ncbi:OprO/OprP family phosphate-selective porin [Brevundimonas sp.]|uniref:OprO/OprP family phosphate-selective porin n=1 Tax=Brevundimonas sp. TaxID=1871086 RepID=UPI003D0B594C